MHGTGYLETNRRHPRLLAAAVALHVGIVGVILSYHPEVAPGAARVLEFISIPKEIPPQKPDETVKERRKAISEPKQQIDRPDTIRTLDTDRMQWPDLPPLPSGDVLTGEGKGGTTTILPPDPVVTSAGFDRRFAGDLQPPYPPALQRAEIEGNVTIRVQIGVDGRVTAVELVKADDPAFFASTRDWVLKRWRFRPATRDGVPIVSWITKTVRFEIGI